MPLIEPSLRREKLAVCGPAGVGKSSSILSVAFWAWQSEDTRKFWYMDFDDSAGDLLLDKKYQGINNIEVIETAYDWNSWMTASEKVVANAKRGDFIVGDMIDRGWPLVQSWEGEEVRGVDSADEKLALAKKGKSGWELFSNTNWQLVNSQWQKFSRPMLLSSPAHIFFTTEMKDLGSEGRGNEPDNIKNARRDFGRYSLSGQKSIPYQMRSVLRLDRLARGRVLYTLKDRARDELVGDDCKDFFTDYMKRVAGWTVEG